MAGADYKSCDVCGCKTVYDANLSYDDEWDKTWSRPWGVGAWKVLCKACADTHEVIIRKKSKRGEGVDV